MRGPEAGELSTSERVELERLRQVVATAPAGFVAIDGTGVIRTWNDSAAGMLGWTAEEIVGKPLAGTLIPTGLRPAHDAGMARYLASGEPKLIGRPVTLPALHRDGHQVHLEFTIWPSWVGEERQFYAFMRDMSAQRAAEEALALSEQRFRAQFTHSAVGQMIRALDGSVIAVNQAFARMLGLRPEDMTGRVTDDELVHPDDLAHARQEIAGLYAGDADSYIQECRLRHADGHWLVVEATVSLVRDAQDQPQHLIVVTTDISLRRVAERARGQAAAALAERNSALEAANRLKLDIIGMLRHEISNPLSAILGYADLIADDLGEHSPAAGSLAIISRQAQRLDEIVREVLALVDGDV